MDTELIKHTGGSPASPRGGTPIHVTEHAEGVKSAALGHQIHPAQNIIRFVNQVSTNTVLGLNGSFGTGKTSFQKVLAHELAANGCLPIYFDAWEADYFADPLPAIKLAIKSELACHQDLMTRFDELFRSRDLLGVFADVAPYILKGLIPVEWKVFTDPLFSKFGAESETEDAREFRDYRKELACTKEVLDLLVGAWQAAHPNGKIVILVDEIDRCRPDFAVEVLEKLKHVFNHDQVCAIIATNMGFLDEAVKAALGVSEGKEYMRRMFTHESQLPNQDEYNDHVIGSIMERVGLDEYFANRQDQVENEEYGQKSFVSRRARLFMLNVAHNCAMSYRDTEKMATTYLTMLMQCNPGNHTHEAVGLILSYLKIHKPDIYVKAKNSVINEEKAKGFPIAEIMKDLVPGLVDESNGLLGSVNPITEKYPDSEVRIAFIFFLVMCHDARLTNHDFEEFTEITDMSARHVDKRWFPKSLGDLVDLFSKMELIGYDDIDVNGKN